jgi:hypothetical protein
MFGMKMLFNKLGVWFSTILANINNFFSFFQLDLLQIILCQTSLISKVCGNDVNSWNNKQTQIVPDRFFSSKPQTWSKWRLENQ